MLASKEFSPPLWFWPFSKTFLPLHHLTQEKQRVDLHPPALLNLFRSHPDISSTKQRPTAAALFQETAERSFISASLERVNRSMSASCRSAEAARTGSYCSHGWWLLMPYKQSLQKAGNRKSHLTWQADPSALVLGYTAGHKQTLTCQLLI